MKSLKNDLFKSKEISKESFVSIRGGCKQTHNITRDEDGHVCCDSHTLDSCQPALIV
ncbi:hypothetical protein OAD49_02560 [Flavobacteriaceae bacterium]|nr:hypothetical protein [Flavobacteriaceae bacterium]